MNADSSPIDHKNVSHREWTERFRTSLVGRFASLGKKKKKAKIVHTYSKIPGGVILDKEIDGFKSWNLDSLLVH